MPPVRFEPTISAGERPHTYALDRPATGIGSKYNYFEYIYKFKLLKAIKFSTNFGWNRMKIIGTALRLPPPPCDSSVGLIC